MAQITRKQTLHPLLRQPFIRQADGVAHGGSEQDSGDSLFIHGLFSSLTGASRRKLSSPMRTEGRGVRTLRRRISLKLIGDKLIWDRPRLISLLLQKFNRGLSHIIIHRALIIHITILHK
jgi:hypothetical protein